MYGVMEQNDIQVREREREKKKEKKCNACTICHYLVSDKTCRHRCTFCHLSDTSHVRQHVIQSFTYVSVSA